MSNRYEESIPLCILDNVNKIQQNNYRERNPEKPQKRTTHFDLQY